MFHKNLVFYVISQGRLNKEAQYSERNIIKISIIFNEIELSIFLLHIVYIRAIKNVSLIKTHKQMLRNQYNEGLPNFKMFGRQYQETLRDLGRLLILVISL